MSDGLTEALRGTYFKNKNVMKQLLYFSADWCSPCKQLGPLMEELQREGYPIRKINIDNNTELSAQYGIRNIPTVILTVDGVDKGRKIGAGPKQTYIDLYNSEG
jgi:thioredoxin 1